MASVSPLHLVARGIARGVQHNAHAARGAVAALAAPNRDSVGFSPTTALFRHRAARCPTPARRHYHSGARQFGSVVEAVSALTPAQVASLSVADRVSLARLGRLSPEKRDLLPSTVFVAVARSFTAQELAALGTADLADLLVCLRAAGADKFGAGGGKGEEKDAHVPVLLPLERALSARDLSGLPDALVAQLFGDILVSTAPPILQKLSSEIGRRAGAGAGVGAGAGGGVAAAAFGEAIAAAAAAAAAAATASSPSSPLAAAPRPVDPGGDSGNRNHDRSDGWQQQDEGQGQGQWRRHAWKGAAVAALGAGAALLTSVTAAVVGSGGVGAVAGSRPPGRAVALLEEAAPDSVVALLRYVLASAGADELQPPQTQTMVAAACAAMLRSGLGKYSGAHLASLAALLPPDTDGPMALVPRRFWDVLNAEVALRGAGAFAPHERVVLAYALSRALGTSGSARAASHAYARTSADLLASLSPSDIEALAASSGGDGGMGPSTHEQRDQASAQAGGPPLLGGLTVLSQFAYAASCAGLADVDTAVALSRAVARSAWSADGEDGRAAAVGGGGGSLRGADALEVGALWDILQLYERAAAAAGDPRRSRAAVGQDSSAPSAELAEATRALCASLERRPDGAFAEVGTKAILNMVAARATWRGKMAVPGPAAQADAAGSSAAAGGGAWGTLSASYASRLLVELARRIRSGPADLDDRRLLLAVWSASRHVELPGGVALLQSASALLEHRDVRFTHAAGPWPLIQILEAVPATGGGRGEEGAGVSAGGGGGGGGDALGMARVALLRVAERGAKQMVVASAAAPGGAGLGGLSPQNARGAGPFARHDLGACVRLLHAAVSADLFAQRAAATGAAGDVSSFRVGYAPDEGVALRYSLARLSAAVAAELAGRLDGTRVGATSAAAHTTLSPVQRQKVMWCLQRVPGLAVVDGLADAPNADAVESFARLHAAVAGKGAAVGGGGGGRAATSAPAARPQTSTDAVNEAAAAPPRRALGGAPRGNMGLEVAVSVTEGMTGAYARGVGVGTRKAGGGGGEGSGFAMAR
jgi:hypothetical protein